MRIDRIMSRNAVVAPRSCTLQEAARLMREHHVGALLVVDESEFGTRPAGIVTDRDLVLQGLAEGLPCEVRLDLVMTRALASVPEGTELHEALDAMRSSGVRRLAVTHADGSLAGIVALDDIVDALSVDLGAVAEVLRVERRREADREADRGASAG